MFKVLILIEGRNFCPFLGYYFTLLWLLTFSGGEFENWAGHFFKLRSGDCFEACGDNSDSSVSEGDCISLSSMKLSEVLSDSSDEITS